MPCKGKRFKSKEAKRKYEAYKHMHIKTGGRRRRKG
jgi:hypothetical protein